MFSTSSLQIIIDTALCYFKYGNFSFELAHFVVEERTLNSQNATIFDRKALHFTIDLDQRPTCLRLSIDRTANG